MLSENNIYYPEYLAGEDLDAFLEAGWYRIGRSLFTTHFLGLENTHRVFWLRYNLKNIVFTKSQRRLQIKNQQFNISVKPFELTDEIEDLYAVYKTSINFQSAPSVHYWLYGDGSSSFDAFRTELIEIRDGNKLIAVGITDWGANSYAGIMNFFDPDYKRYSLGKYLMSLKIKIGKKRNFDWYYPGYIIYQKPQLDYKLSFEKDAVEVFIPERDSWLLYDKKLIDKYGIVI